MTSSQTTLTHAFAALRTKIDEAITSHLDSSFEDFQVTKMENTREFAEAITNSLQGGKRFRALSALVGGATALALTDRKQLDSTELIFSAATEQNLALGSALEMYQAAALVHDDVVDRASERRGRPATHVEMSEHHRTQGWLDDSKHFGLAAALLIGDYLLAAAPYTLELAATGDQGTQLRRQFELMTGEVALGQYLDLKASNVPLGSKTASTQRIVDVVRLKSARYSIAHPVSLGARQCGASVDVASKLESIFEAAGIAFQLRDDDLGVFGDVDTIGKSASGDVLEKKRTVLLALTYENAPAPEQAALRGIYGQLAPPSNIQVEEARRIMKAYGRDAHETFISDYRELAEKRLQEADFPPAAVAICKAFIELVIDRRA